MLKITNVNGKVSEGELYAIDPVTKTVIIKTNSNGYSLFPAAQIANIQGDLNSAKTPEFKKMEVW